MFRLYREPERGEFFVVAVDCAQGGIDANFGQFLSKTHIDVPHVFEKHCVAAEMTPIIHEALEPNWCRTGRRFRASDGRYLRALATPNLKSQRPLSNLSTPETWHRSRRSFNGHHRMGYQRPDSTTNARRPEACHRQSPHQPL